MPRRTDEQIFLDTLTYLAGNPPSKISSKALSNELGWNDDRYSRTRARLIDASVIRGVKGGPGGSLEFLKGAENLSEANESDTKAIEIFVSYSHADSKLKGELVKHLSPLERLKLLSQWHDGEIKAGDHWEEAIVTKLQNSKIILLLVSSDFIASKFCYEREMTDALDRDKNGTAKVIPIILRPCLWQGLPFGKLQAAPFEGKPVTSWDNLDEAMMEVAKAVREVAQKMLV